MEMIQVGSKLNIDAFNKEIKRWGISDIEILNISTEERYTGDIILSLDIKYKEEKKCFYKQINGCNAGIAMYMRRFGIPVLDLIKEIYYILEHYKEIRSRKEE